MSLRFLLELRRLGNSHISTLIVCVCEGIWKTFTKPKHFCSLFLEIQWLRNPGPQHEKRTLFGDMVCFLFITPLATISGWLCLRGAVDHLHFSSRLEAIGLIALTVALFTIYLFWTLVSIILIINAFGRVETFSCLLYLSIQQIETFNKAMKYSIYWKSSHLPLAWLLPL